MRKEIKVININKLIKKSQKQEKSEGKDGKWNCRLEIEEGKMISIGCDVYCKGRYFVIYNNKIYGFLELNGFFVNIESYPEKFEIFFEAMK